MFEDNQKEVRIISVHDKYTKKVRKKIHDKTYRILQFGNLQPWWNWHLTQLFRIPNRITGWSSRTESFARSHFARRRAWPGTRRRKRIGLHFQSIPNRLILDQYWPTSKQLPWKWHPNQLRSTPWENRRRNQMVYVLLPPRIYHSSFVVCCMDR